MNPASRLPLAAGGGEFTQPRARLLADPCKCSSLKSEDEKIPNIYEISPNQAGWERRHRFRHHSVQRCGGGRVPDRDLRGRLPRAAAPRPDQVWGLLILLCHVYRLYRRCVVLPRSHLSEFSTIQRRDKKMKVRFRELAPMARRSREAEFTKPSYRVPRFPKPRSPVSPRVALPSVFLAGPRPPPLAWTGWGARSP